MSKEVLTMFRELRPLINIALERGQSDTRPFAPEIEQWISEFIPTNTSLQLCLSATRFLTRTRSVVSNFELLHKQGRELCMVAGEDYEILFKGVTESDVYRHLWR